MNRRRTYKTIIITGLYTLIGLAMHFFLTPYIINNIGIEGNGFVTLSKTITSYITIVSTAFNSFAARFIAISYNQGQMKKYQSFCSTVFWGNVFLSLMVLILGFLFSYFADILINIPDELIRDVKLLFLLTFLSFSVNLISTVYSTTAYVKNRLDIANIIRVFAYLVEALIVLLLFCVFKPHIWYVSIATLLSYLCILFGFRNLTFKITPEFDVNPKNFSVRYLKDLFFNGIWNSLNSLGNTLNSGLDLLVSNLFLSVIGMGQIAIAKSFNTIMSATLSTMSTPFQPVYIKMYAENKSENLISEMCFSSKICSMAICLIFSVFIAFGKDFFNLWIPGQDINTIYWLCVITLLTCVIESPVFPFHYTYTLTLKNRFPCIITIVGGLFNVIGMYLLLKFTNLGVYSIVITTLVVMGVIELITNPIYISRCLKVNILRIYKQIFFSSIICIVEVVICLLFKIAVGKPSGWLSIITDGFFCVLICSILTLPLVLGIKKIISFLNVLMAKIMT